MALIPKQQSQLHVFAGLASARFRHGESFLAADETRANWHGPGDKAVTVALANRAVAANPIEKDAVHGPTSTEILARVAAQTGRGWTAPSPL